MPPWSPAVKARPSARRPEDLRPERVENDWPPRTSSWPLVALPGYSLGGVTAVWMVIRRFSVAELGRPPGATSQGWPNWW
jgi:hypothetical protein